VQSSRAQDLKDFDQMILDLIIDLKQIFNYDDEIGDLAAIEFFYKTLPSEILMKRTIKYLLPHKKQIEKRKIKFFKDNMYLFSGLDEKRVLHYRNAVIDEGRVSLEDLNVIWSYLEALVALTESYINH
jgi:hypothetical protein